MRVCYHPLISPGLGVAREITSYHFGLAGSGKKVYIQSSLHADELPGMLVSWQLRQTLAQLEAQGLIIGEVVLVPVANPIGLSQQVLRQSMGRYDLDSGEDFNRGFEDLSRSLIDVVKDRLTQSEAQNLQVIREAAKQILAKQTPEDELSSARNILLSLLIDADVVLDLHCDWESVVHLYANTDGWQTLAPLARYLESQVSLLAESSGGMPIDDSVLVLWSALKEAFGDQYPIPNGVACATIEHRGQRDTSYAYADKDAKAIVSYMVWLGVIKGEAPSMPDLPNPATPLAGSLPVKAVSSGVIVHLVAVGSQVKKNQALMEVIDPHKSEVSTLYSPVDGVLYQRHFQRLAYPGMAIAYIAGVDAVRSGNLLIE
ncbi:M14 family metallopeptidase [Leeia sp. TBRC 13508]|uniref:M14 family metallopeptidase n=1 Tax=Leeia speluncae TaxID=2884804 RepID=A0ABS8D9E8_9NEIS|nr:succinylglutamate desuccinylase/aspartoacylase family protein [Leeia speluncae]MCB6184830.1 M14 family metallopeptidase [Leeia speluncae]